MVVWCPCGDSRMPLAPMSALIDAERERLGFLGLERTMALASRGVTVVDPFSTLVSAHASLQDGVVLWPGIIVQGLDGSVVIGSGTVLFPNTRIVSAGGSIMIGSGAEIGEEGGFTL